MSGERLSILQVITPARYSGAERMMTYLSAALQARGHRVVVACKPNEALEAQLARRGIEVYPLSIASKVNLLAPIRLVRTARRAGTQIIHTHLSTASLWGSLAARALSIPALAHVHGLNTKYCFLLADAILTPSEGVRQHLLAQGVRPERVHVVYNGVPPERFADLKPPEQVYRELGLSRAQPIIAVVAHLSSKKGHRYLLEAVARLKERYPQLVCLVVGEGPLGQHLRQLAGRLEVTEHVRFLGHRNDAVAIMRACDVVVLPSIAKEGLGLCIIEAAFLGKPTVGSRAPGIDEAIADGQTGLLVSPADSAALAAALDRLLGSPQLRAKLGQAGKVRAERLFALEAYSEAVERLYWQVLDERTA